MRDQDQNRFSMAIDSDKVVVDVNAHVDIISKPKWDAFENNHFAMRRRLVYIFLKVANLFIVRLRAGKRLSKLKQWISSNNIKTRADMVFRVLEDYKKSVNLRVVDDTTGDSIYNTKLVFGFSAD